MFAEEVPHDIGEDVIRDDEEGRNDEPDEAFVQVVDHEPSLHGHQQSGDDYPPEQPELVLQVAVFEAEHEGQEPNDHEHEANEAVIS